MYSPKEPCLPLTLNIDTQVNWNVFILEAKGVHSLGAVDQIRSCNNVGM